VIDFDTTDVVRTSAEDLIKLWAPGSHAFPRAAGTPSSGSTSTPRAIFALIDAMRHLAMVPGPDAKSTYDRAHAIVLARAKFLRRANNFDHQRISDINAENTFTDSHLALEAQVLAWLGDDGRQGAPTCALFTLTKGSCARLEENAQSIVSEVEAKLSKNKATGIESQLHDFVTYHSVRLLSALSREIPAGVLPRVKTSVMEQIALHAAGSSARFDLGALVFGAALLQQGGASFEPLIRRSLDIIVDHQAEDGSWPELRTIYRGGSTLFISSYEVGLTLSNLLLRRFQRFPATECGPVIEALKRTLDLARVERRQPTAVLGGWGNDRNPSVEVVEGWTTAVVCSFASRVAQVAAAANLQNALRTFDAADPPAPDDSLWPDLERYRQVGQRRAAIKATTVRGRWQGLPLRLSDPTEAGKICETLVHAFIKPVQFDWAERPAKKGISLLLPGDPGTRKTTLVNELAKALGWPVLTLTPPSFLRGGLEKFESEAAAIFRELQRLERVIVFFDECEEFFRSRTGSEVSVESRTSGAFITAGMLPRLQSLHDQRTLLFVVATNAKLQELDPAAIREGRFDDRFDMFHPRPKAQVRYLRSSMAEVHEAKSSSRAVKKRTTDAAIRQAAAELAQIASRADTGIDDDRVPFNVLDDFRTEWIDGTVMDPDAFARKVRSSRGQFDPS
jgi:hypothetical protein